MAKVEAITSLKAPRHKDMSMLSLVLSEPGDALLPPVVMKHPIQIPGHSGLQSAACKACRWTFFCTFRIHPATQFEAIASLIAQRHKGHVHAQPCIVGAWRCLAPTSGHKHPKRIPSHQGLQSAACQACRLSLAHVSYSPNRQV